MVDLRDADLLPVRMLTEYVYCPRLGYLEYAQGEFVDNAYTLDGTQKHKTVDEFPRLKDRGPIEASRSTWSIRKVSGVSAVERPRPN